MWHIIHEHLGPILVAVLVSIMMSGSGYLIAINMAQHEQMVIACIDAGNQFIDGDCVK